MEETRIVSSKKHFLGIIYRDPELSDPRKEYDHIGVMLCVPHRNYRLGDRQCGVDEMSKLVRGKFHLPLYLLDHSGITMRTTDFRDPWDSGQVGYIYADMAAAERLMGRTPSEKELRGILESEVKEYDCYLRGDVWGYDILEADRGHTVEEDRECTSVDSCWGLYGYDYAKEQVMAQLAEFEQQRRRTYPRWLPLPGLNIQPKELK